MIEHLALRPFSSVGSVTNASLTIEGKMVATRIRTLQCSSRAATGARSRTTVFDLIIETSQVSNQSPYRCQIENFGCRPAAPNQDRCSKPSPYRFSYQKLTAVVLLNGTATNKTRAPHLMGCLEVVLPAIMSHCTKYHNRSMYL